MAPQAGHERPATPHRYLPALSPDRAVFLPIPHPVQGKQQPTRPYFALPGGLGIFAPTSATVQTDDKTSDRHPVTYTSQVPPHPFSETPTTKRKVFRKLTEQERSKHHDSLAPLARWCESTLPEFESLSPADIELFTDVVLEEVATSYHNITTPSHPISSALVKKKKSDPANPAPPQPSQLPRFHGHAQQMGKLIVALVGRSVSLPTCTICAVDLV